MGNSASALPYSINSTVDYTTSDGWSVSGGVQKSNGNAVTVFHAKKPALLQHNTLITGHHFFLHAKKLRHPQLLQVYATLDTDAPTSGEDGMTPTKGPTPTTPLQQQTGDYIVVTEPCIPLEQWLDTSPTKEEISWALYCMVQALGFLHNSAALAHGNLSPESWKVTTSGDVKLWNYAIVTSQNMDMEFQQYEQQVTPNQFRSPERQARNYNLLKTCGIHTIDSYGLGILMRDVLFSGNVPTAFQKALQRLLSDNPKSRPRLVGLLKCPMFQSPYIHMQQQLAELAIQPVEQKISIWQSISPTTLNKNVAMYKLLPLLQSSITTICTSEALLKQDLYKREVLSMLPVLFGIWEYHGEECTMDFTTTIGLLMRVQDRAVRGALLQKMALVERQFANKSLLNAQVFEPMCSGFSDSSAALRELTLKSTLTLIPHLSPSNMEKLSRYLTRLQSDTEPSIRTNSMVLIIKVTPHLTSIQKEKLLLPSLQRGLNDSFDPCRLACLTAILGYSELTPEQHANRILPIVTPKLLDPSKQVRTKAFEVVEKSMQVLKETHEKMSREVASNETVGGTSIVPPQPQPAAASAPVVAAAPSSGGYLSGFSSWMSSSTKPETAGAGTPTIDSGETAMTAQPVRAVPPPTSTFASTNPPTAASLTNQFASTSLHANNDGWDDVDDTNDDDDGWGNDNDLLGAVTSPPKTSVSVLQPPSLNMQAEEDFFKSFETKQVPLRSTGGKLAVPSSKAKKPAPPKITKLKVDASDWDDF